jgi:hypothetical protein
MVLSADLLLQYAASGGQKSSPFGARTQCYAHRSELFNSVLLMITRTFSYSQIQMPPNILK